METNFIKLTKDNIEKEHICCAITSKDSKQGYELKKQWLKQEFDNGYVFRRLNERAKVFIEYVSAEKAWIPVTAPNYLMIDCFWVSGSYKGKGYAKSLLQTAIDDAKAEGKDGLVTVVGTKKFHFMSDPKWFLKQGFEDVQQLPNGFSLLVLKFNKDAQTPSFNESTLTGECPEKEGLVVYYSHRCPFTENCVNDSLIQVAKEKNIPLKIYQLSSLEEAQSAPTPATIFSLFYNGKFVTTDVSICLPARFDKGMAKFLDV